MTQQSFDTQAMSWFLMIMPTKCGSNWGADWGGSTTKTHKWSALWRGGKRLQVWKQFVFCIYVF